MDKIWNYGVAVALVAGAAVTRVSLDSITTQTLSFSTFFPAVLLAALLGGQGAGIFAALLSTVIGWYAFMLPRWTFKIADTDTIVSVVLYLSSALLIVWIAERYRGTLRKLREEEQRRDLLLRELHHRSKNTLAVSQTIVNQTLKGDSELAHKINGRLTALAAANDMLVSSDDQTVRLSDLVRSEIEPYGTNRVRLDGPGLRLSGQDARSLSLLVHELATNAAKYGALVNGSGLVDLHWTYEAGILELMWRETGGPPVQEPAKAGFGSQLIRSVAMSLNGTVDTQYRPEGLTCTIKVQPGADTNLTTTTARSTQSAA